MLDIKYIKNNVEKVKDAVRNKQLEKTINIDDLLGVYDEYSNLLREVESLRTERNKISESVTKLTGDEKTAAISKGKQLKEEMGEKESALKELKDKFDRLMLWVPNVPADDVPIGQDSTGNVIVRTYGEKKSFDFEPKNHLELIENLGIADTKRGAKIGGFRSYFIVGKGMLLEQAILRYALDHMVEQGFTPMNVPVMVDKRFLVGTGYFPWGEEDHYSIDETIGLAGTAEVALTSYYADEVLEEKDLPVKVVGLSPCFRKEVGSYGKDTQGIFRVHYFNKVEQVLLLPEGEDLSREWHDKMLGYAEDVVKGLGLSYQVLLMCTGDMGAGQRRKYDIETWFEGEKKYRETHSDSYFLEFQARRFNMRYKAADGTTKYVSTINNTVAATPRLMAAVLESYQQKDGSVVVPEVLRKYTGFDVITPIRK